MASYLDELFGLAGQTAVVIGGTGVLGGALATGLARAGAMVVVAGRGAENGQARVREIAAAGGRAAYLPVDVTKRESIAALLAAASQAHGK
ncbi:MAG TPA: SDR family NAD(P)-dependent oxidoreductase, partial [Pirellulales bacterium]|nr:SDR family NAD(P)-dependent oxidoreductase [Pirellulales bacterium]